MHYKAEKFANDLLQQPVHYIYTNYDRYDVFFTYHSFVKHKNYKVDRNISFDITKPYDCLVMDKATSMPSLYEEKGYKLFYEDSWIQAFQRIPTSLR